MRIRNLYQFAHANWIPRSIVVENTMELASQLLHVDGYLLQLDAVGYDQFGNVAAMKDFALSLGMELDLVETGTPHEKSGRMRKIMIWKKSRKTNSIMR